MTQRTAMENLAKAANAADKTVKNARENIFFLEKKQIEIVKFGLQLQKDWNLYFKDFDQRSTNALKIIDLLLRRWETIGKLSKQTEARPSYERANEIDIYPQSRNAGFNKSQGQLVTLLTRTVVRGMKNM